MSRLLTPLELKVMKSLWRKEKAFVKEILEEWDEDPKPAYNTISTIVRILCDKQFVKYKVFGRTYQYYPAVNEHEYQRDFMKNALKSVFSGSMTTLVSTLVDSEKIGEEEMEELRKLIDNY